MALAYLTYKGQEGDSHRFHADTGINRFYRYRIGAARSAAGGMERVDEPVYNSPLMSAPTGTGWLRTDFMLDIPASLFSPEHRFVQLYSYRDAEGNSPALSDVVNVQPLLKDSIISSSFSTEIKFMNQPITTAHSISMEYREKPVVSQAMFWNVLLSALPTVVNLAMPAIKKLLGGEEKKDKKSDEPDKIDQFIAALIPALQDLQSGAGETPQESATTEPPVGAASLSLRPQPFGMNPVLLKRFAKLLEKIITLETLQAIGDDPEKLLRVIIHSVQKATTEEEATGKLPYHHFRSRRENGVNGKQLSLAKNTPDLTAQLLSMIRSGQEQASTAMRFRLHPGIALQFLESSTVTFHGKNKVVYAKNGDISIPLRIDPVGNPVPDRTIPKAMVQLVIWDSDTLKRLLEKRFRIREQPLGQLIPGIVLTKEEIRSLPGGKDLIVEASFLWPSTRDGKNVGTFKQHHILLTDGYLFDRMGDTLRQAIPLNDVHLHRAFWHKIWEGTYNSRRWELDFDCKYYHTLGTDGHLGKMETKAQKIADNIADNEEIPERRKVHIRLKSGMEWSVEALNALLPELSMPSLTPAQVSALKTAALAPYFQQAAHTQVGFRGRSGEAITLWVYPELSLRRLHLLRVSETNALGQIVRTEPEEVVFPHPNAVHFIGTKTEQ